MRKRGYLGLFVIIVILYNYISIKVTHVCRKWSVCHFLGTILELAYCNFFFTIQLWSDKEFRRVLGNFVNMRKIYGCDILDSVIYFQGEGNLLKS